jgi:methylisocitrate lyase
MSLKRPAHRLRELLADTTKPVVMPGAFNALAAKAIERAGFDGVYVSGAGMANAVFALPDVGLTTLSELFAHTKSITTAVALPVIVDGDTGFGEAINAARTIGELHRAGAAGCHLEDQQLPKRCGHLKGKTLVPAEAMCEKIRAAVAAKPVADFVLIARTDARGVEGFDSAVERAKRYLEAGADAIFPEALKNAEEFEQFARQVKAPLLANMTEFGQSPLLSVTELGQLGYRMVVFPQSLLRVAFKAIGELLGDLRKTGTQTAWVERMQTRSQLYELLGYDALEAIDAAARKE